VHEEALAHLGLSRQTQKTNPWEESWIELVALHYRRFSQQQKCLNLQLTPIACDDITCT
jgi:hypothetical protein